MKFLLIACLLTQAAAVSSLSSSEEFLADLKHDHDASGVMQKLQGMMGAAQQKLSVAERHHKKVVKKIRKEADKYYQDEATVIGKYLNSYAAEVTASREELKGVIAAAKAGIAKSEAKPANPNDWKDPEVEQRAKLSAKVAAAEHGIKKAERKQSRQVREAEEGAEEKLEDEAAKLSMKLGDMSPSVDTAKKTLEAVAEKEVPAATTAAKSSVSGTADLKSLQDNLAKAVSKDQAKVAEANKGLDNFLAKAGKNVADETTKIQDKLQVAQKKEIEQVIGRKADDKPGVVAKVTVAKATPPKKAEETKAKAAPAKATPPQKVDETKAKAASAKATPVAKADVKTQAAASKAKK